MRKVWLNEKKFILTKLFNNSPCVYKRCQNIV